jgi:hypothetical protein
MPCVAETAGWGQALKRTLPGGREPAHIYQVRPGMAGEEQWVVMDCSVVLTGCGGFGSAHCIHNPLRPPWWQLAGNLKGTPSCFGKAAKCAPLPSLPLPGHLGRGAVPHGDAAAAGALRRYQRCQQQPLGVLPCCMCRAWGNVSQSLDLSSLAYAAGKPGGCGHPRRV